MTRAPSPTERRVLLALAVLYGALTLAVLPVAERPGPALPHVIAVCNGGLALADFVTALILAREFRRAGKVAFLMLCCAYLFSGTMALFHAASFKGAVFDPPLFTGPQTVIWMYLMWRLGTAMLLLASVLVAHRGTLARSPEALVRLIAVACGSTLAVCAVLIATAAHVNLPMIIGTRFTTANFVAIYLYLAVLVTALVIILRRRAFGDVVFLWLAVFITALIAEQIVGSLSGGQYTVGWHVSKASSVVSSCLLLVFWLSHLHGEQRAGRGGIVAAYGAAFGVMLAAIILRWFVTPWAGLAYPFSTLYGAVAVAVWIGGWPPALLAAAFGYLAAVYLFVEPAGSFSITAPNDTFGPAMYWISSAIIIGLGEAMRRANARQQRSEALFRDTQEAAIQGFTLFDAVRGSDGRVADLAFRYINEAGARYCGKPAKALTGRKLSEAFPASETVGIGEALRRVAETGEPLDTEVHYAGDGIDAWFRHLAVKIGDGVGTSYIEITENKRLEDELRHRAAALQRADTNKSQFLAVLSHELRNPLAPLLHGLTLLKLRSDAAPSPETLSMMERQLLHLRRLIDDLLDVSRIDRGKLELRRDRIQVESVVRAAIDAAKPALEAKSHELVVRFASEPLYVDGDEVRLSQVVCNLLNNAAKFTPPGGRIEVAMRHDGPEAIIAVQDTGIGFAADNAERIFEMFLQLEANRAYGGGGLGLGLSVARSLVEMHGGRIEAHSDGVGRGAVFTVRLPLAMGQSQALARLGPTAGYRRGARILVVDDNVDAADALAQILRFHGFEVSACYDGIKALQTAERVRPTVAFIDLDIPGIPGIALGARIRSQAWGKAMRLVAVTGMGQPADVQATRSAGFDGHLTKPAALDEVLKFAGAGSESNVIAFPASLTSEN
jgi:signal transduction histidine kinase/ActR/RegA family two-component response regulator